VRLPPLLAALAAASGCATAPLDAREWLLVATPHFEVASALGREETLDLARDAERFHQAIEFVLGAPLAAPAVPTRIYAFDDRRPGRPFALRSEPGYFLPSLREARIVLRTGEGWRGDATRELRHEYVHYLLRSQPGVRLPLWFDEGAAEFLSTVEIGDERIELGVFRPDHVKELRSQPWLPLVRILETRELESLGGRRGALFPAATWLFVHYLNFGLQGAEGRTALARYLERSAAGAPAAEALRLAFGRTGEELDDELQGYVRRERFDSALVRPVPFEPGEVRALGRAEVARRLGELSLALRRPEQAEGWFRRSVAADRLDARAHAGLGVALGQLGPGEAAAQELDVALGIAQEDPLNHLDAASYYLARALRSRDAGTRTEFAEGARRHAARSSTLAGGGLPESYALYATSYLVPGQDPAGALPALEEARRLLPGSHEIDLLFARVDARLGRSALARERVVEILARTHSQQSRDEAEQILGVVDSTVARRQILKGPEGGAPGTR
jgi:tetratricopeptide (TPR) repeat protein